MTAVAINNTAVVVAASINMLIGWVWYSMPVFGRQWMKQIGKTEAELKATAKPAMYLFMLVAALIMACFLAQFVGYANATSAVEGAMVGFYTWLGFVATTFLGLKVFENRSWELYWINVGYYLFALLAMGALLAVW